MIKKSMEKQRKMEKINETQTGSSIKSIKLING